MRLSPRYQIYLLFVLFYLIVGWFNIGFMGTDEYFTNISRFLPAQGAHIHSLVNQDDVKSPMQILPFYLMAKLGYFLSIESAFMQYRFMLIILSLLNAGLICLGFSIRFNKEDSEDSSLFLTCCGLFIFHFASVGLFTRPMFEAISAPWIFLSAVLAWRYDLKNKESDLFYGVICASIAFVLRQQAGMCSLVFVLLPLLKKQYKSFIKVSVLGLLTFILSGIPDVFLRGGFHYSLRALFFYNAQHGAEYTNQPWWYFFPLILGLMFTPWLLFKSAYSKASLHRDRVLYIILVLFIFPHMFFANKFERFLIPILPVLFLIMLPVIHYLILNSSRYKLRLGSLVLLNGLFWLPATFSSAQQNIIDLAVYLDSHHEIKNITIFEDSVEWIPDVFIQAADKPSMQNLNSADYIKWKATARGQQYIVVNEAYYKKYPEYFAGLKVQNIFPVNWVEALAYKINPKRNVRRSPLILFSSEAVSN